MGDSSNFFAIWLPLFIVFFIIFTQRTATQYVIKRKSSRRRLSPVNNDLVKQFTGKKCMVSTGSFGSGLANATGTVKKVQDNWIEMEDKKGKISLINLEFVVGIKEV